MHQPPTPVRLTKMPGELGSSLRSQSNLSSTLDALNARSAPAKPFSFSTKSPYSRESVTRAVA
eukprot:279689-Prymnesium_polylepis.2